MLRERKSPQTRKMMFVRSPRPAMRSMSPSILTPLRFVRITHGSVTFITRALMAAKAWSFRMLKRLSRYPSTMNTARDITLAKLSSMIAFRLFVEGPAPVRSGARTGNCAPAEAEILPPEVCIGTTPKDRGGLIGKASATESSGCGDGAGRGCTKARNRANNNHTTVTTKTAEVGASLVHVF